MITRTLGGRPIAAIGFGAMQLPGPGVLGPPRDREAALAVLRRAIELGVDHVDTAQYYGPDVANELIRAALHPYPEGLRIVTKIGARRDEGGGWLPALAPDEVRAGVEANLRSLGVERLAMVNLRLMGPDTPLQEPLGVLAELRERGRLELIGMSEVTVDQLDAAQAITDIAGVQNQLNLVRRDSMDVLRACEERGLAFTPYFPLGSAFTDDRARIAAHEVVVAAAERHGATPAQVALAWLLGLGEHVLLIPGTSSVGHLEENLAAADLALTSEELSALDALD